MGRPENVIGDGFWQETEPVVMSPEAELESWLRTQPALRGHLLFKTSGVTGSAKYVCLSRKALRQSAEMVQSHLEATAADVWLGAMPMHHVGGFGVAARAAVGGCGVHLSTSSWDPEWFCREVERCQATLTALVPAQVFDVVGKERKAPRSLRAVLVGGGALPASVENGARLLGWPLLKTFGMTETASQLATQALGSGARDPMVVLPDWEVATDEDGVLRVRGGALFSGYVWAREEGYQFDEAKGKGGWFDTSDLVRLAREDGGRLTLSFVARLDERLKIKGELVNLAALRTELEALVLSCGVDALAVTLVAMKDARDEHKLILVSEARISPGRRAELCRRYNAAASGLVRLRGVAVLRQLPRTELGKLDETRLVSEVDGLTLEDWLS